MHNRLAQNILNHTVNLPVFKLDVRYPMHACHPWVIDVGGMLEHGVLYRHMAYYFETILTLALAYVDTQS